MSFYFNSISNSVDMNFKPLLKTLACVCVRQVVDKFITLG